jgi:16S rRNA (cytosine1402-N4)-methyltransferase
MPSTVLTHLAPVPGDHMVDATVGVGGHARLIAEKILPGGKVLGLDQDEQMLKLAKANLDGLPVDVQYGNFHRLFDIVRVWSPAGVSGVLADLGLNSAQLDDPDRGFSFLRDGPLDMRMDRSARKTAAELVNRLTERDLADIIYRYGEERFSRRIARRIVEERKRHRIFTTGELTSLIHRSLPPGRRNQRIDPATRVFQALRIAVNDELEALESLLRELPASLRPGGRAVIISYHSLEDRLVKHSFRDREKWEVLTPKPVQADEMEVRQNPRARSAKLRAARRLPAGNA